MEISKLLNLLVRFLLELGILAAVGHWGFSIRPEWWSKLAFGIGAPLLIAILWGVFGAPKAVYPLSGVVRFLFELLIFGAAPVALFATGQVTIAWLFVLIYLVNKGLIVFWQQ